MASRNHHRYWGRGGPIGLALLLFFALRFLYRLPLRLFLLGKGYADATGLRSPFIPLFWALAALVAAALALTYAGVRPALPWFWTLAWLALVLCFMEALVLRDHLIAEEDLGRRGCLPRQVYLLGLVLVYATATAAFVPGSSRWLLLVSLLAFAFPLKRATKEYEALLWRFHARWRQGPAAPSPDAQLSSKR